MKYTIPNPFLKHFVIAYLPCAKKLHFVKYFNCWKGFFYRIFCINNLNLYSIFHCSIGFTFKVLLNWVWTNLFVIYFGKLKEVRKVLNLVFSIFYFCKNLLLKRKSSVNFGGCTVQGCSHCWAPEAVHVLPPFPLLS